MTTLTALQSLIAQGESETLGLNRSTAELKRAGETLCAFPNCDCGKVLIGVGPDGKLLDRNHSRHRWENQSTVGVRFDDLDPA